MIEVLTTTNSQKLLHQLNTLLEQESRCQPKVCDLRLIESAHDNGLRMTARLRDFEVKDLLSLTQFFGFNTETFSLAVNLLDRFLSKMKVRPKHLGCVGLRSVSFLLYVKAREKKRKNWDVGSHKNRRESCRIEAREQEEEGGEGERSCWGIKLTNLYYIVCMYKYITTNLTIMYSYNAPIKFFN
uniref:Cyclin N-terminal domain-containing protein n=1 Tax=Urocitellus parryii TaxID=9999 RepID=A0A8D2GWW4_UROPR